MSQAAVKILFDTSAAVGPLRVVPRSGRRGADRRRQWLRGGVIPRPRAEGEDPAADPFLVGWAAAFRHAQFELAFDTVDEAFLAHAKTRPAPDFMLLALATLTRVSEYFLDGLRTTWPETAVVVVFSDTEKEDFRRLRNAFAHGALDCWNRNERGWLVAERLARLASQRSGGDFPPERESAPATSRGGSSIKTTSLLPLLTGGRIDAAKLAEYIGVPLRQMAQGIGANYNTVYKTPHAPALQAALHPILRSLELLQDMLRDKDQALAWLNRPHTELENETPLQVMLSGNAQVVCDMLEGAASGTLS